MKSPEFCGIAFSKTLESLPQEKLRMQSSGNNSETVDARQATLDAFAEPLDFPSIASVIVDGDRVALAVDPNIPDLLVVLAAIVDVLQATDAAGVDVVLWEEASDETVTQVRESLKSVSSVTKHASTDREQLRYLGADDEGNAVYLNRLLVDADMVLPIVATRKLDASCENDLSAVYPCFADSATRIRHRLSFHEDNELDKSRETKIPWLLGILVNVIVTADDNGGVSAVVAGLTGSIQNLLRNSDDSSQECLEEPLVIASLDGSAQQQTWENATRAIAAAARMVKPEGTIVLWSNITSPPTGLLKKLDDFDWAEAIADDRTAAGLEDQDAFPEWRSSDGLALTLAEIATDHRIVIHSNVDAEAIEAMGLGVIESESELLNLCNGFETFGVIRTAQYAGSASCLAFREEIKNQ